ncbi:UDP-N-acetylmuramoyl-L-alanine--D-glutamate ligase [Vibrio stylophorae]|uniref:UDP-N-acetylmuramoyl-L-alanine--D-glutamate ligase n=1 Tax=Vibrio stylophorae TaxID=659351 RepID=UPI001F005F3E|nr:UDP-N-acetylmuramoyl-L-alanine--D-glutamate ligase [Vibrio stylophorae]
MPGFANLQRVCVVGLGMTGLSVVNYLRRQAPELEIYVIDTRAVAPGAEQLPANVALYCGGFEQSWLNQADLIVASPGIGLATPALQEAQQAGVPIVGDIELFALAVSASGHAPILAITGSNGKSTVTSLLGEMAKADGRQVGVGGNIGFAALDMLKEPQDLYVLELSSFQLETTSHLNAKAGVYLNLSEDHMDRYQGMADYDAAKQRLFAQCEVAIANQDDPATWPKSNREYLTFGFEQGDYVLAQHQGKAWLQARGEWVMPIDEIALIGRHNVANALAAIALAQQVGISLAACAQALREYHGLPHRCQCVHQAHGIRWVNDSKATNLASTGAALNGLMLEGRLHLLLGGDGKGADFSELAALLAPLNVAIYCYGRDGDQMMPLHPSAQRFETLEQSMSAIASVVKSGDMVLLSPACASWDQFPNFMVRGETFAKLAEKLSDSVVALQ